MASISPQARLQRPSGVTIVAVIAAVLGGLGLLTALWTILASLLGMQAQANMFGQAGTMPAEQQAAYRDMMTQMQTVVDRWRPITLTVNSLVALVSAGLLVGGIAALRNRPGGRKLLVGALLAGALAEIAWLAMMIPMQLETNAVTERSMAQLLTASAPQGKPMPKEAAEITRTIMKVTAYVGIVIFSVWAVAKSLFFALAARYLGRPHVLEFYQQGSIVEYAERVDP
jgi:hypothetical protein